MGFFNPTESHFPAQGRIASHGGFLPRACALFYRRVYSNPSPTLSRSSAVHAGAIRHALPGADPRFRARVVGAARTVEPHNPSHRFLHREEGPMKEPMKPKIRLADDTHQRISFRIDAELARQMRAAARKEPAPMNLADFTRTLLLWALPHYRAASSLRRMRQAKVMQPGDRKRATRANGAS